MLFMLNEHEDKGNALIFIFMISYCGERKRKQNDV